MGKLKLKLLKFYFNFYSNFKLEIPLPKKIHLSLKSGTLTRQPKDLIL